MVSVSCFCVRVSVMFHFMCVHYTFSSVWVAECPLIAPVPVHCFSITFKGVDEMEKKARSFCVCNGGIRAISFYIILFSMSVVYA